MVKLKAIFTQVWLWLNLKKEHVTNYICMMLYIAIGKGVYM